MDYKEMREIAAKLTEGTGADIWYDAHEHRDDDVAEIIDSTQNAMIRAARFLNQLAEIIE